MSHPPDAYPEWTVANAADVYSIGDRVVFKGRIWESVIDYNAWSPEGYRPGWKLLATLASTIEEEGPYEEWEVNHSGNVYMIGDRVSYDGKIWESIIDYNAWSPDEYRLGWLLLSESEEGTIGCQDWDVDYAGDAYMMGEIVLFDNLAYVSLINYNVWSPTDYPFGWELASCNP